MTHDAALKAEISSLLEAWGFQVEDLEKREGLAEDMKRPDFMATQEERFLIEVKEKQDDPSRLQAETGVALHGGIAHRHEYWGPKNTVAGIVRDAKRQLEAWPTSERDYCLLWLHAGGQDAESQMEQFRATLFGTTNLYALDNSPMKPCYFFYDSDFYRWGEILDGAILTMEHEGQFWVNPFSSRADQLKVSSLARAVGQCLDPRDFEQQGEIFLADCEIDRKNTAGVKKYVQEKYGTAPLDHIHLGRTTLVSYIGEDD